MDGEIKKQVGFFSRILKDVAPLIDKDLFFLEPESVSVDVCVIKKYKNVVARYTTMYDLVNARRVNRIDFLFLNKKNADYETSEHIFVCLKHLKRSSVTWYDKDGLPVARNIANRINGMK